MSERLPGTGIWEQLAAHCENWIVHMCAWLAGTPAGTPPPAAAAAAGALLRAAASVYARYGWAATLAWQLHQARGGGTAAQGMEMQLGVAALQLLYVYVIEPSEYCTYMHVCLQTLNCGEGRVA